MKYEVFQIFCLLLQIVKWSWQNNPHQEDETNFKMVTANQIAKAIITIIETAPAKAS